MNRTDMRLRGLPRLPAALVLGGAVALAFFPASPAGAAEALPYSHAIRLVEPADGATISFSGEDEVVTFSFHVDSLAIRSEIARLGPADNCGSRVDFYVSCVGSGCKNGPPGMLTRDGDHVSLKISALLALTTDPSERSHRFVWGGELRDIENRNADPPCVSIALAATAARLTIEKKPTPSGPPRLSLSVDPDVPSAWPKTIAVTDAGGPSKATFLVVSVKTLAFTDPVVARNCSPLDGSRTHTVEVMPGGGSRRTFDVPPLPPSRAQADLLLKAMVPAAASTPPPGKTPLKASLASGVVAHDPNVHQVVTCQYRLDAHLGSDTNAGDPNKADNALSRTIRIDVPIN